MATYVTLYKFTEQGVRNIQDSPKRIERLRQAFKAAGAEMKQFYALMGQYDTMIISEAASDEVIIRLNLMIDSMGDVSSQTMRAFGEAEWKAMLMDIPKLMAKAA